jgi:glycosyltransferase involved in cell wall biosynthesis
MKYYIIMPVHNEEAYLAQTLDAVVNQTLTPDRLILVDDNSTDNSGDIIERYAAKYPYIKKVTTSSSELRLPGSKVVNAFKTGLRQLDDAYDFIVKLDADLILPAQYFERIAQIFTSNPMVGIAGGFLLEKDKNGQWNIYHPMDKNHVRGGIKSYTKQCFAAIGGLKNAIGWDTVDELLAQYHGFELYTDESLTVKNLRPVGMAYSKKAKLLQGEAMYRMRYGFWISVIASLKMAAKKRTASVFTDNLKGYFNSKRARIPFLVTVDEGEFIRKLRWQNIRKKLL